LRDGPPAGAHPQGGPVRGHLPFLERDGNPAGSCGHHGGGERTGQRRERGRGLRLLHGAAVFAGGCVVGERRLHQGLGGGRERPGGLPGPRPDHGQHAGSLPFRAGEGADGREADPDHHQAPDDFRLPGGGEAVEDSPHLSTDVVHPLLA